MTVVSPECVSFSLLGNDHLYEIVAEGQDYELWVDLEDFENNTRYTYYDSFSIGSPSENYKLTVGGYSGDAGDHLFFFFFNVISLLLPIIPTPHTI